MYASPAAHILKPDRHLLTPCGEKQMHCLDNL